MTLSLFFSGVSASIALCLVGVLVGGMGLFFAEKNVGYFRDDILVWDSLFDWSLKGFEWSIYLLTGSIWLVAIYSYFFT